MGAPVYFVRRVSVLFMACYYSYGCSYWQSSYRDPVEFDRCIFEDDKDEVSHYSKIELSQALTMPFYHHPLISFFLSPNPPSVAALSCSDSAKLYLKRLMSSK